MIVDNTTYNDKLFINFVKPGVALDIEGVLAGTVLVDGHAVGGHLEGNSRIFRKGCPIVTFYVSGNYDLNKGLIDIIGSVPTVDNSCKIVGYEQSRLMFLRQQPFVSGAPTVHWDHNNPIFKAPDFLGFEDIVGSIENTGAYCEHHWDISPDESDSGNNETVKKNLWENCSTNNKCSVSIFRAQVQSIRDICDSTCDGKILSFSRNYLAECLESYQNAVQAEIAVPPILP